MFRTPWTPPPPPPPPLGSSPVVYGQYLANKFITTGFPEVGKGKERGRITEGLGLGLGGGDVRRGRGEAGRTGKGERGGLEGEGS